MSTDLALEPPPVTAHPWPEEARVLTRPDGGGWLALLGGGEFTFGETLDADQAWLAHAADGPIGFVPAASGSPDYGRHFSAYLQEGFGRTLEVLPVYRSRDARRGRHLDRLAEIPAVYLGGGVTDQLVEALLGEPFGERLLALLRRGGVVAAIAAAAQALGAFYRPLRGGPPAPGLGWLPGGVVEANFDPDHDRRLLGLLRQRGVRWAVGLPAGSALLLGPGGALEVVGEVFVWDDPDGEPSLLTEDDDLSEDGDT